jgi:hypothetical protein
LQNIIRTSFANRQKGEIVVPNNNVSIFVDLQNTFEFYNSLLLRIFTGILLQNQENYKGAIQDHS